MYKILIVEDDEKIAGILEEHLERYGYQSFRASDLRQIKDEFVKVNPHLVLLDINLPYFDGFSLVSSNSYCIECANYFCFCKNRRNGPSNGD